MKRAVIAANVVSVAIALLAEPAAFYVGVRATLASPPLGIAIMTGLPLVTAACVFLSIRASRRGQHDAARIAGWLPALVSGLFIGVFILTLAGG